MKKLFITTAILIFTALFSIPTMAQSALSGEWTLAKMVVEGKETPLVSTGKNPTMNFGNDGINGSGSCNNYGGSFTTSEKSFKIGPVRSTKMACAGEINAQEMAFFSALSKIDSYELTGRTLNLYGEGGLYVLTFTTGDSTLIDNSASATTVEPAEKNFLWIVNKTKVDCQGVAPQKCLQVKETDAAPWENFYGSIAGFKYKPGKYYLIRVKRIAKTNVPADASAYEYKLIKVMSRTRLMPHVD